ncbi:unnamed protein product [Hyaloperonospora brassicae]|uniref:Uncharacterized protein n=1 Tax=Hyaloperonospora brassicae TaxID=162125 RepID=A0AAV0UEP1_HYABA|nr:unnamed protein product [Hyaloperonospora brassicae]
MTASDNENDIDVVFQSNALDVVGSWLIGGSATEDSTTRHETQPPVRRPVTLYRPSSSSAPTLTRPNAAHADSALTETEREMKHKMLRKRRGTDAEEAVKGEQEAQTQRDEAQDEEEQELVRLKTQRHDRKRKRTAQDELLDALRGEAAKKKAKNLKRKLQLQRKTQQQRQQKPTHGLGVATQ